jgi:hypothetical protein
MRDDDRERAAGIAFSLLLPTRLFLRYQFFHLPLDDICTVEGRTELHRNYTKMKPWILTLSHLGVTLNISL